MYIELMAIQHVLKRWLQTPDAPICEISPAYGEKRNRPYTEAEIRKMRDLLKRHVYWTYIRLLTMKVRGYFLALSLFTLNVQMSSWLHAEIDL
jgi:hypothetical protein